jgi:hypothetical protein
VPEPSTAGGTVTRNVVGVTDMAGTTTVRLLASLKTTRMSLPPW